MFMLLGFLTGLPGPVEMLIVGAIILLLFGNRLPSAMRSLGRSVVEFKKGVRDDGQDSDQVEDKSKQEEKASK